MEVNSRETAQAALQNAQRMLDELTVQHRQNRILVTMAENEIDNVLRYLAKPEKGANPNGDETTNLGLTKPDGTDKVMILVLNGNFDKIDEAIGAIRAQQIPAEVITAAVDAYMAEHEVASGATPDQANQIEANKTNIETLTQTVNNLNAEDVGARPDNWMPTASDVGARPDSWMPTA